MVPCSAFTILETERHLTKLNASLASLSSYKLELPGPEPPEEILEGDGECDEESRDATLEQPEVGTELCSLNETPVSDEAPNTDTQSKPVSDLSDCLTNSPINPAINESEPQEELVYPGVAEDEYVVHSPKDPERYAEESLGCEGDSRSTCEAVDDRCSNISYDVSCTSNQLAAESTCEIDTKESLWNHIRTVSADKLNFVPLDTEDILTRGELSGLKPSLNNELSGPSFDIMYMLSSCENTDVISRIITPMQLSCDCCQQVFTGSSKLQDMLNHLTTDEHKCALLVKVQQNPLYLYELDRSHRRSSSQESPVPSSHKGERRKRLEKHLDVPEQYRSMADWIACYVCNTTCSSLHIYEIHAVGKRHMKILSLSRKEVKKRPYGPYIVDGKPTIDTDKGPVKIVVVNARERLSGVQEFVPCEQEITEVPKQEGSSLGANTSDVNTSDANIKSDASRTDYATSMPRSPKRNSSGRSSNSYDYNHSTYSKDRHRSDWRGGHYSSSRVRSRQNRNRNSSHYANSVSSSMPSDIRNHYGYCPPYH